MTTPDRLLIVLPSWLGDAVMATPTLRRLRRAYPGHVLGALARPPVASILEGLPYLDEVHPDHATGVLGPKRVASRLRPRRYSTALLLTNSFSTALVARVAGIPRRVGYDRDARRLLLTEPVPAPRLPDGSWALTPAVDYYWRLASVLIDAPSAPIRPAPAPTALTSPTHAPLELPADEVLELAITSAEHDAAEALFRAIGIDPSRPYALLNPGGNNTAKRWPADRFAALADHLANAHNLPVLISGAPTEADLTRDIAARSSASPIALPDHAPPLAALKPIFAHARIVITNDTGPRHIAAAFGVPTVSLFGPTDPRWTTIPTRPLPDASPAETILVADPTLPPDQSANDHPQRCAIERITTVTVRTAVDAMLARPASVPLSQR